MGKRDPIAALATLILLSYSKLLSVTITVLSFATLRYPDGTYYETVWLPDGNVRYFQGKHIPLVLAVMLIITIGLPYTALLFLWQWLAQAPKWKLLKWTGNTKLTILIAKYHIPHCRNHRYWTGLLLLVRVVLYISAPITVSANPKTFLLLVIILVGGLVTLKAAFGLRVYTKAFVDIMNSMLYCNILVWAVFSLYNSKRDVKMQLAVAYLSSLTTLVLLIGAIGYHVSLLVKKARQLRQPNENLLAPAQLAESEITHSSLELPPVHHSNRRSSEDSHNRFPTCSYQVFNEPQPSLRL